MKPLLIYRYSPRIRTILLLIIQIGLPVSYATAQSVTTQPTVTQMNDPVWIKAGAERFAKTCAFCHGSEGDSGKVQPFRERVDWNPVEIHDVIANGRKRGSNIMPAWGESIPDEDIWRITAFIRSLSGKAKSIQ